MDKVLFSLGDFPVTAEIALYAAAALVAALLLAVLVVAILGGKQRAAEALQRADEAEAARKQDRRGRKDRSPACCRCRTR